MKTRSNMPLFVVECSDVKALSNSQIDLLRCGDYLVKKDASGEHAYKVTFKSDTGMCITYQDAYCVETQSYDKVGGDWVYNSEDKTIIAEPSFENIVDKDGNKRFNEWDISLYDNVPEGVTKVYGKCSISGSHLLLVLFLNGANTTVISNVQNLGLVQLPKWIIDKIYPIFSSIVDIKQFSWTANDYTGQGATVVLDVDKVNNYLKIRHATNLTLNKDRFLRITFDLLIDDE